MATKRKGKSPTKKTDKATTAQVKAAAAKSGPAKMDAEHAQLIADAEKACKIAEAQLTVATDNRKKAKEAFDLKLDTLRKLAGEITDPGLFGRKDRK